MFELFNDKLFHQLPTPSITGWNQARNVLNSEYLKLERYHRSNVSFVPNGHVLLQILNTAIPSGLAGEVAIRLSDSLDGRMTSLGIGSPFGRPDFSINSWFYNRKTYEVLIQDSSLFDADYVMENWQDARPVRILHHPFNDMSLAYPNGKYAGATDPGFAVISINPTLLLMQYKGYIEYCKKNKRVMQAPAIYVSQYPIFNMLKDHVDIALRNRFINIYKGLPVQGYRSSYAMSIVNPSSYVDAALASAVKAIGTQPLKYNRVLEILPAFTQETQREITPFPLNAMTHSTQWIYDMARAPLLEFLLTYSAKNPNFENNDYLNDMRRSITEMELDKSIPYNASPVIRNLFNSIKDKLSVI